MKINEIICEMQIDEVAPLIAAIGSGLATAAKGVGAVGSAAIRGAGNVATQIGKTAVSQVGKAASNALTSMGSSTAPTSNDSQAKKLSQQQIQANLKGISPGTKFAYPELGQVEVLPLQSGQQGLRLRIPKVGDVTVDPKDLTNLANNLPK